MLNFASGNIKIIKYESVNWQSTIKCNGSGTTLAKESYCSHIIGANTYANDKSGNYNRICYTTKMSVYNHKSDTRLDSIITCSYILSRESDTNGLRHYCEAETSCWDTGATNTSISPEIIDALRLTPVGKTKVSTFGGTIVDSDVYLVDIILPGNIKVENLKVLSADSADYDVVIGMDVITLGDMCISNKDGKTCFSFRLPSKEHIQLTD